MKLKINQVIIPIMLAGGITLSSFITKEEVVKFTPYSVKGIYNSSEYLSKKGNIAIIPSYEAGIYYAEDGIEIVEYVETMSI